MNKETLLTEKEFYKIPESRNDVHYHFMRKLVNFKNPVILELGVNKGSSTAKFLEYVNNNGGELYSIDIVDCSKIIKTERFKGIPAEKWHFLKSNDLDLDYILHNFPKLKDGIDLIYIDSYHDFTHVNNILKSWYVYMNKFSYLFFDDTESGLYKTKKDFFHSFNNDSLDKLVKDFHSRNYDQVVLTKYFSGSGLSELFKISELGSKANFTSKLYEYNYFIGRIYLFLKKIMYHLKKKDKKKNL